MHKNQRKAEAMADRGVSGDGDVSAARIEMMRRSTHREYGRVKVSAAWHARAIEAREMKYCADNRISILSWRVIEGNQREILAALSRAHVESPASPLRRPLCAASWLKS